MCEANPRIRKNDEFDYCRQKGIGEKTVKITGPKNLIVLIQIAFKLIIIQFLSLHIGTSYDYTNIKKLNANFKTYPGHIIFHLLRETSHSAMQDRIL